MLTGKPTPCSLLWMPAAIVLVGFLAWALPRLG